MTAQINYTEEQTLAMVNDYKAGVTVDEIATNLGKSVRSVIAKLTREGVYRAKTKKAAGVRITKEAMTQYLEDMLQLEAGSLKSLEKGTYEALQLLCAKVTDRQP